MKIASRLPHKATLKGSGMALRAVGASLVMKKSSLLKCCGTSFAKRAGERHEHKVRII
tara:strand:- start:5521 stop:5694 length:174 start_codon:yes stop_codon:yes gene_type:complete